MSLANGITAHEALRTFMGARDHVKSIELRLKTASAAGTLLAEDAKACFNSLTVHESNLAKGDPSDFPRMNDYAQEQLGDDSFDYFAEYAALVARIRDLVVAVDQMLTASGTKERKLSSIETAALVAVLEPKVSP